MTYAEARAIWPASGALLEITGGKDLESKITGRFGALLVADMRTSIKAQKLGADGNISGAELGMSKKVKPLENFTTKGTSSFNTNASLTPSETGALYQLSFFTTSSLWDLDNGFDTGGEGYWRDTLDPRVTFKGFTDENGNPLVDEPTEWTNIPSVKGEKGLDVRYDELKHQVQIRGIKLAFSDSSTLYFSTDIPQDVTKVENKIDGTRAIATVFRGDAPVSIRKVDSATGKEIPADKASEARFEILGEDGVAVRTDLRLDETGKVVDAEGMAVGLPFGQGYKVREVVAPNGYVLDPSEHVLLVGENVVSAVVIGNVEEKEVVIPPTEEPTEEPTVTPTEDPTAPDEEPTAEPTAQPSAPVEEPSVEPTEETPTAVKTTTLAPSEELPAPVESGSVVINGGLVDVQKTGNPVLVIGGIAVLLGAASVYLVSRKVKGSH